MSVQKIKNRGGIKDTPKNVVKHVRYLLALCCIVVNIKISYYFRYVGGGHMCFILEIKYHCLSSFNILDVRGIIR